MRIDSHQHFWNFQRNGADYPWIDGSMPGLQRDFWPADLSPDLVATGFDGCVTVQAREVAEETDDLLHIAEESPFVLGVVGWFDLTDPDVEAQLDRHADAADLKGLRMQVHDRADPDFAASDAHVRGVGLLARYGLTYDLLVRPAQMPAATDLARRLPNQPFVLDHIGKPDLSQPRDAAWFAHIDDLAACPNVHCKLSGLVTEADRRNWAAAPYAMYLDHVLAAFGPERLMIGSDWPVCTLVAPYADAVGVVADWARRLSERERTALYGGNAAAFYGLETS